METPELINRELSWLAFNERVLAQVMDSRTPLLERLKFLGIFTTNLDEYFMIRVAGIKEQLDSEVTSRTPDGLLPQEQLQAINERLIPMLHQRYAAYQALLPELAHHGIHILEYDQLGDLDRHWVQTYFKEHIFPVLTPLGVGPSHPFPYMSNLSLSLGVVIRDAEANQRFARIKIPQHLLKSFIALPRIHHYLPVEQVIAAHLHLLFPGMAVEGVYKFRVTRNADIEIQEDEAEDLLLTIEQELRRRRFGEVVRLEVSAQMPTALQEELREALELEDIFVYTVPGLMDMNALFHLASLDFPQLKESPFVARTPERLLTEDPEETIFDRIRAEDILVHHPYDSFTGSVEQFIRVAAADPQVLAIKQTLYRTGGEGSAIIQALMEAAEQGKQVAVLVELKARFDEANNITWARALENAGVHVVYGLLGLKTHCKVALVVRQEEEGLRRYIHIGTGNYNAKTAKLYTDFGLFTCDPQIGADATDLFNYLTGYSAFRNYRKLLVAPVTLRSRLADLIQRETDLHSPENPGHIMLKMNSLVDPALIALLYQAAEIGVQIDLVIRGICCLRPTTNIQVISIVGRFLEHSRVLYFRLGGAEEVYIGSADWMTRNLDKRVEVLVPITDPGLKQDLISYLTNSLQDTRRAWRLLEDGSYQPCLPQENEAAYSIQETLLSNA